MVFEPPAAEESLIKCCKLHSVEFRGQIPSNQYCNLGGGIGLAHSKDQVQKMELTELGILINTPAGPTAVFYRKHIDIHHHNTSFW